MFGSDALGDYRDAYAAVDGHSYPVLMVWGDADTEIANEVIDTIRGLVPRVEFHVLPGWVTGLCSSAPPR